MNSKEMLEEIKKEKMERVDKSFFLNFLKKSQSLEDVLRLMEEGNVPQAKQQLKLLATILGEEFTETTQDIFEDKKPNFMKSKDFLNPFKEIVKNS